MFYDVYFITRDTLNNFKYNQLNKSTVTHVRNYTPQNKMTITPVTVKNAPNSQPLPIQSKLSHSINLAQNPGFELTPYHSQPTLNNGSSTEI